MIGSRSVLRKGVLCCLFVIALLAARISSSSSDPVEKCSLAQCDAYAFYWSSTSTVTYNDNGIDCSLTSFHDNIHYASHTKKQLKILVIGDSFDLHACIYLQTRYPYIVRAEDKLRQGSILNCVSDQHLQIDFYRIMGVVVPGVPVKQSDDGRRTYNRSSVDQNKLTDDLVRLSRGGFYHEVLSRNLPAKTRMEHMGLGPQHLQGANPSAPPGSNLDAIQAADAGAPTGTRDRALLSTAHAAHGAQQQQQEEEQEEEKEDKEVEMEVEDPVNVETDLERETERVGSLASDSVSERVGENMERRSAVSSKRRRKLQEQESVGRRATEGMDHQQEQQQEQEQLTPDVVVFSSFAWDLQYSWERFCGFYERSQDDLSEYKLLIEEQIHKLGAELKAFALAKGYPASAAEAAPPGTPPAYTVPYRVSPEARAMTAGVRAERRGKDEGKALRGSPWKNQRQQQRNRQQQQQPQQQQQRERRAAENQRPRQGKNQHLRRGLSLDVEEDPVPLIPIQQQQQPAGIEKTHVDAYKGLLHYAPTDSVLQFRRNWGILAQSMSHFHSNISSLAVSFISKNIESGESSKRVSVSGGAVDRRVLSDSMVIAPYSAYSHYFDCHCNYKLFDSPHCQPFSTAQNFNGADVPWCGRVFFRRWKQAMRSAVFDIQYYFPSAMVFLRSQPAAASLRMGSAFCIAKMNKEVRALAQTLSSRNQGKAIFLRSLPSSGSTDADAAETETTAETAARADMSSSRNARFDNSAFLVPNKQNFNAKSRQLASSSAAHPPMQQLQGVDRDWGDSSRRTGSARMQKTRKHRVSSSPSGFREGADIGGISNGFNDMDGGAGAGGADCRFMDMHSLLIDAREHLGSNLQNPGENDRLHFQRAAHMWAYYMVNMILDTIGYAS